MSTVDEPACRVFVSQRNGLLRHVRERRSPLDGYSLTDTMAQLRSLGADGSWVSEMNGGGHLSRERSRAAALGESLERYCLSIYHPSRFIRGDCSQVEPLAARPEDFRYFLDEQFKTPGFPFQRFSPDWPLVWVEGYSLLTGRGVHVPASLVYLPYVLERGERALSAQLSPGTSCHRSYPAAVLRAILEIVERDALTICWETQATFPMIEASQVEAIAERLSLRRSTVRLMSFELTTDLELPVVLTLAVCPDSEPEVAVGIAAHVDGVAALERSIDEAISTWRSTAYLCRADDRARSELLEELKHSPSFAAHALYHGRRGALGDFAFLLESSRRSTRMHSSPVTSQGDGALLDVVKQRLARCGQDAVLFDLSQRELAEYGFFVVRAVMPGLVRQSIGLIIRHLANPRLLRIPAQLGLASRFGTSAQLLAHPQPFP